MKILLFGKSGQVGWELQRSLAPLGDIIALDRQGESHLCGDLTQPDALDATVRAVSPTVIVNAAAYTAVDKAESEPGVARAINAIAVGRLASAASKLGALLVHYSTDYVFNGSGSAPWAEASETGPQNVYGQTKLEGENLILAAGCQYLVLRTSWVYAARGDNFLKTMLRLARERSSLSVVNDQFGSPTGAELIADVTAHAVRAVDHEPDLAGLYNLAAAGETTWHEYAGHVINSAREMGSAIRLPHDGLHSIPTAAFPTPARRPANSRLDCRKLEQAFGLRLPPWRRGVDRVLAELLTA